MTDTDDVPVVTGDSEVTLVPTEPRPPEVPSTVDEVPIAETINISPVAEAPVPEATAPVPVTAPAVSHAPVASIQKPVVIEQSSIGDLPIIKSLAKGSYYIQIATMSDTSNVRNLFNTYGKKYPVAIEKVAEKNGEVLKVYIGPIQKDEYGVVLDKFKKLGFKDAFVKKGQ